MRIKKIAAQPVAKHIIKQSNFYNKKNNLPDGDSDAIIVEPKSGSGIESNSNRDSHDRKNAKSA